jgi:hypothetical protein
MGSNFWSDLLVLLFIMGLGLLRYPRLIASLMSRERDVQAGRELLRWWAGTEGWAPLRAEPARPGPFGWRGRIRPVFRFTVRDECGETRSGWALCGGGFSRVQRRTVKVAWDDPPGKPKRGEVASPPSGIDPLWEHLLDGPPG